MLRMITATMLAAAALAAPDALRAQDVGLPIGSTPEPVALENLDGETVDLGRYIGSTPMVLEFWARWCPLCAELEPRMRAARERFGDRVEFVVVAVGVNQTPRSIRRHLEDHPVSGRVLFDAEGRAVRAFRAPGTSYVVVLDEDGRVTYTGAGGDQDIEAAVESVL